MAVENHTSTNSDTRKIQFAEDPRREPHEKETTLTLSGDRDNIEVTSFKKSVFAKLIQRPTFEIKRLHILDDEGREHTVGCLDKAAPSDTVIGVTGWLPVGAITIGKPRNSNSHADIVK